MKLILSFFLFSWVSDASADYQLSFQDSATTTMEGIYLFNLHLLFVIIGIVVVVAWLLYSILINFTKFNKKNVDNFTNSNTIEIVWTTILAFILLSLASTSFSLLYSLDEISNSVLTLKILGHQWYWSYDISDFNSCSMYYMLLSQFNMYIKKLLKTPQYLSPVSYCLIFAIVVISFYWECYLITIYCMVTVVYMTFFSQILPCEKFEALKLQNQIDSSDYDKIVTNKPFVVTVLLVCGIGIYYGFLMAKLYLFTLLVMIITRSLGYKVTTFFPFGIRLLKNIRKDMIVLKYHWYTHFKNLRNINHINLITLSVSLVLGSLFSGDFCSEHSFNLNYMLWNYLLGSHCVFVVSIDVYILFFMNMESSATLVSTCIRCFVGLNGVLYCNYNLAESGLGPQTSVINTFRPFLNSPIAHDCESVKAYKAMKAAFPLIDEKTYLIQRPNTVLPGGASAETYEVNKPAIWAIARDQDVTQLSQLSVKDQQILRIEDIVKNYQNNQIPQLNSQNK